MSLVSTLMQSLRAEYEPQMDKNELRASRYGAYDLFKKQSAASDSVLTDSTKGLIKKSFGNTVGIPVLNADNVTIGSTRSCNIQAGNNTSAIINLTFITYAFGFSMYPAEHYNNQINYQTIWDRNLRKYLLKFQATLDELCISKLNADRNQFWNPAITAIYPQTANALQVSKAATPDFYNQATSIMEQMDFYGNYDVVANTLHRPVVRRLMNQGAGNDENDAFQFDEFNFGFSNRVTNGLGIASTAFLVPGGTVAIENRNDPDAILGHTAAGGGKIWEEVDMPLVGLKMASYYNDNCTDASLRHTGTSGLTRTKVESYEFSTDICVVTAYNSAPTTAASPIVKAEFSAT